MNKDCPYCKLSVPKDLVKCKCGYLFEGYNESGVTKPSPKVFREITDFDMPFLSMVIFIFKWSFAAIPTSIFWIIIYYYVIKIIIK